MNDTIKQAATLAHTDPAAAYDKLAGKLPPWLKDKDKKDDKDEPKEEGKGGKDKEDKPEVKDTSKLKGGLKKWQEEQNAKAKKEASVAEALVLASTDPAAAYDKLATKVVPLAEAKKGDMVEVSYRGKKFTGKVVQVKKDGTITVDPMSDDINEGAWIDFHPPKKASVEEALKLAATDPAAAYDKLAEDKTARGRAYSELAGVTFKKLYGPTRQYSSQMLADTQRLIEVMAQVGDNHDAKDIEFKVNKARDAVQDLLDAIGGLT